MWDSIRESLTPGRVAAAAAASGFVYVAYRVYSVSKYYTECKRGATKTPGLKSKSWSSRSFPEWFALSDPIMGGRSQATVEADRAGRMLFSGTISTVGGGFASARTSGACAVAVPEGATFVKVVAEGDGQMYKLALGLSTSLMSSSPVWTQDFVTERGVVKQYWLPLSKFVPARRGQQVQGAAPLELGEVQYVGILLSLFTATGEPNPHFGSGPFRIVVHEINFQ